MMGAVTVAFVCSGIGVLGVVATVYEHRPWRH